MTQHDAEVPQDAVYQRLRRGWELGEALELLREAADWLVVLTDTYGQPPEVPALRDLIARMRTCAARAR